jgi:Putative restriction endonuclease
VAEVISPGSGSERTDRLRKVGEYARLGIPQYWIVEHTPLPSSWAPDNGYGAHGSPVVPVWLFAPCSSHGLGGVAAGTTGA